VGGVVGDAVDDERVAAGGRAGRGRPDDEADEGGECEDECSFHGVGLSVPGGVEDGDERRQDEQSSCDVSHRVHSISSTGMRCSRK